MSNTNNIIIITKPTENGCFVFVEDELKALINEAYNKGYYQGTLDAELRMAYKISPIMPSPQAPNYTNPGNPWWSEVTCNQDPLGVHIKELKVKEDCPVGEQIPIPFPDDMEV